MTPRDAHRLLDVAAAQIVAAILLVALAVRFGYYAWVPFAWFPVRWALVRVTACRPADPPLPRREPPFGYREEGPV